MMEKYIKKQILNLPSYLNKNHELINKMSYDEIENWILQIVLNISVQMDQETYRSFSKNDATIGIYKKWDCENVGIFITIIGLGDFRKNFESNCIEGSVIDILSDTDLNILGLSKLGDKMRFKRGLKSLIFSYIFFV